MTFEEFLIKKKIDAIQFKAKELAFFCEFESHYLQMGEKSFDHSKKFWFNKLRRAYHLKEDPKPVKEEVKIDEITASSQTKPLNQVLNQEKPAYVPRFKAASAQKADQSAQNIESDPTPANVPAIKPAEKEEDAVQNMEESGEKVKPIYKPKFKAQIQAQEEMQPEDSAEVVPLPTEPEKPAYKPRFKPGLTKKNPDS